MIDLREAFEQVSLDGTDLDEGRARVLLAQLARALGSEALAVEEADLGSLPSRLRNALAASGAAASTVKNQVYRLNKILRLATDQGLLPSRAPFELGFEMPPRPSGDGPAARRHSALGRFARWCVHERIRLSDVTRNVFLAYRSYLLSPDRPHGRARAEVLYTDLVAAWRGLADEGRTARIDCPRWKEDSITRYGLPRRSWPRVVERDFACLERGARNKARPGEKRWTGRLRESSLRVFEDGIERLLGYVVSVRGLDVREAGLRDVLGDQQLIVGFIEWHRDERCGGEERHYHSAWLSRFGAIHQWLTGGDTVATRYRTTALSIVPRRVRDPFPARPVDYSEFVEGAVRAAVAAMRQWRELAIDAGRRERIAAACALRDAVCLALIVCRPMRSENLRNMKLDENLVKVSTGSWRLAFGSHEMKTRSYACDFPCTVSEALELYLAEARPVLAGSRWDIAIVFPTKTGRPLSAQDLWRRMIQIGLKYLGIKTNPHLFRYLIPSAYLLRHPDRLVEMQALLGHANLAVTLRCYVRVYSQVASRRVAELQRAHCPSMRRLGELLPNQ